jgi:NAD(P)-dependent dehydrogenase (short-subunit alcohol dehydrogenase family)
MNALTGKVIVINGGTQGLGEAAARACASAGAAGLVLTGRSGARGEALAAELTAAGTPSIMVAADVTNAEAPGIIATAADARFGVVHGLANVAAATYRDNVWTATAESFDQMMAINVRTPLLLTQACGEIMRRENVPGSVVSIGSMSGYGGQPFLTSYCTSKGALMTLTKNLAYSLVRHGIRVNLINAGWMDTESEDAVQRKFHGAQDGWLEAAEAGQPLGRLVKPQEVARSIVYCLSDDSGLMSGAIIDFDQGVLGAGDVPKPSAAETPQP